MHKGYKCEYCDKFFYSPSEAEHHERHCGRNPENKVDAPVLFRLSMIYESMPYIVACALHDIAFSDLGYLEEEALRAADDNCFFAIETHKSKMLKSIRYAYSIAEKRKGRTDSEYNWYTEKYPALFSAIVATLLTKAWNEQ